MGEWQFDGYVRDAGGGTALIVVGRDTDAYPTPGAYVTVTVHDPDPKREYPEPTWPLENQQQRKPRTIGWTVSETYAAVRRIEKRLERPVEYSGLEAEMALSGELFVKRRSEEDWQVLIAQVNDLTRQRDELLEMVRTPALPIQNEPYLGLASNEQMLRELISRLGSWEAASAYYTNIDRVVKLAEMLGGMSAPEREYRTVDNG